MPVSDTREAAVCSAAAIIPVTSLVSRLSIAHRRHVRWRAARWCDRVAAAEALAPQAARHAATRWACVAGRGWGVLALVWRPLARVNCIRANIHHTYYSTLV